MSEHRRHIELLDELSASVENLMLSGMTAASKTTQDKLTIAFKEASRMRLLRLGSTLRIATEEMKRFEKGANNFSKSRLSFFLGRAWLLSTSMANALRREDSAAFAQMNRTPTVEPAAEVKLVVLGVLKRHVPGAFSAFEMRARSLEDGEPLTWPFVFPANKNVPPEAFLSLEQKLKYRPADLLKKRVVTVTKCALAEGPMGGRRMSLGKDSSVEIGDDEFSDWSGLATWDRAAALMRLRDHEPDPLALPIELQEEAFISSWSLSAFKKTEHGYDVAELESEGLCFQVRVSKDKRMKELLAEAAQSTASGSTSSGGTASGGPQPLLMGVLHYELCRLVLQPLSLFADDGPNYLAVSEKTVDKAALVKALNLT